jgi:hypothetical protein
MVSLALDFAHVTGFARQVACNPQLSIGRHGVECFDQNKDTFKPRYSS